MFLLVCLKAALFVLLTAAAPAQVVSSQLWRAISGFLTLKKFGKFIE
jgi:hypothetical protein